MYRKLRLPSYDLEIEIKDIPDDGLTDFLSGISLANGLSKLDYEQFIIGSLVKDIDEAEVTINASNREQQAFRFELLSCVYKVNPKLQPQNVIVTEGGLMHISDAMRLNKGGHTLPTSEGWYQGIQLGSMVDSAAINQLINHIWEDIKTKAPDKDYIRQEVDMLGIDIPVLNVADDPDKPAQLLDDFVHRRMHGDLSEAQTRQRYWIGHILAYAVPRADEILHTLKECGYISAYGDNIVMMQLYNAVISVNPNLSWDRIDWAKFLTDSDDGESKPPSVLRRPTSRSRSRRRRSSKEEVEESRLHFSDIDFETILDLPNRLKKEIVAQDDAIEQLCEAISVARVGLRGTERPIGSFLLAGPTGVGKTELSKVLARELTNNEPIRVDCSEYQSAHEIAKLFGAPPGYIGFEDHSRGMSDNQAPPITLASRIRKDPFSVVLFDELEKADDAIFNVLLQIMDDGRITSGRGDVLSFNESVILLTSNIGTKEAAQECSRSMIGFGKDERDVCKLEREAIRRAIEDRFRPEFRNRLTSVITFNKLNKEDSKHIADLMVSRTKTNLEKAQQISMWWGDDVREYIVEKGFSDEYGARNLARAIQKHVELPVAKWILEHYKNETSIKNGSVLYLTMKGDDLVIDPREGVNDKGKKKNSSKTKRVSSNKTVRKGQN